MDPCFRRGAEVVGQRVWIVIPVPSAIPVPSVIPVVLSVIPAKAGTQRNGLRALPLLGSGYFAGAKFRDDGAGAHKGTRTGTLLDPRGVQAGMSGRFLRPQNTLSQGCEFDQGMVLSLQPDTSLHDSVLTGAEHMLLGHFLGWGVRPSQGMLPNQAIAQRRLKSVHEPQARCSHRTFQSLVCHQVRAVGRVTS